MNFNKKLVFKAVKLVAFGVVPFATDLAKKAIDAQIKK